MQQHPEIANWNADPEFIALPEDVKQKAIGSYFDGNLVDDEFFSLPSEQQQTVRKNFIQAHVAKPKAIDPEKAFIDQYNQKNPDKKITEIGDTSYGDYPRALAIGLDRFGQTIGRVTQWVGADETGEAIEDHYKEREKENRGELSPAFQYEQQKPFLSDKEGEFFGEGATSVPKIAGTIIESAPSMAVGMGTGTIATQVLMKAGMSAGLAGIIGSGFGEGGIAAVESAKEFEDIILKAPAESLLESEEFEAIYKALPDSLSVKERFDTARRQLATETAQWGAVKVGAATSLLGGPSGWGLGKALKGETGKTLVGTMAKQGVLEAAQEAPQSAYEVYAQNEVIKENVDPSRDLMEGTGEAAVAGAITGGVMGVGLGGSAHNIGKVEPSAKTAQAIPHDKPTDLLSDQEESRPIRAIELSSAEPMALPAAATPQQTEQTPYDVIPAGDGREQAISMPMGQAPLELPQAENTYPPIEMDSPRNTEAIPTHGREPNFEMVYTPDFELVDDAQRNDLPVPRRAINLPVPTQSKSSLSQVAHEAATSPANNLPEPTQAQKEAGNYKKGHTRIMGMDIAIENPASSERSGVDGYGKDWAVQMQHHYGYIKGTVGKDKDHLDLFIKDGLEAEQMEDKSVYVVDQINEDGSFDEHKIMAGFDNEQEARAGYLSNYEEGWSGLGAITEMSPEKFKQWIKNGKTKRAVSYRKPKVAPARVVPEDVNLTRKGTPYTKGSVGLVIASRAKKGENVEAVQLDSEGKEWGWRTVRDEGPELDTKAQEKIRGKILAAVPDRDYDSMVEYADTLIDNEGFSTDDVYEVIDQIDEAHGDRPVFSVRGKPSLVDRASHDGRVEVSKEVQEELNELAQRFQRRKGAVRFPLKEHNTSPEMAVRRGTDISGDSVYAVGKSSTEAVSARKVASLFGKELHFIASDSLPIPVDGAMSSGKRIFMRPDTVQPIRHVLGHELLHSLKKDNQKLYNEVANVFDKLVKGSQFKAFKEDLRSKYNVSSLGSISDDLAREEVIADISGDLFLEPKFWKELSGQDTHALHKFGAKAIDILNRVISKLSIAKDAQSTVKDVRKMRDAIASAMREYRDQDSPSRSSKDSGIRLSFAKAKSSNGSTVSEVQSAISKLEAAAVNAGRTEVVQSVEDLPKHIQDEFAATGGGILKAAYHEGNTYLVADSIPNSKQAVQAWMHEHGVHHGLRGFFGEKDLKQFLNKVHFSAAKSSVYKSIVDLYGLDINKAEDRQVAAEEYLAHVGEKVKAGETLSGRDKSIWQQIVAMFRRWLNQMGFSKNAQLTYAEIEQTVADVISWTVHGPVGQLSYDAAVAFSKDATEEQLEAGRQLQEDMNEWGQQLDNFSKGKFNSRKDLQLGETPDVLRKLGIPARPMVMVQSDVAKVMSNREDHAIPLESLKQLPLQLAAPVMVFKSATVSDAFVFLTEIKLGRKSVMAAVHYDTKSQHVKVNKVASMYGGWPSWYARQIEEGRLVYRDKKKSLAWARTNGLQLPKVPLQRDIKKILTEEDIVKPVLPGDVVRFSRGNTLSVEKIAESALPIEGSVEAEQDRTSAEVLEDIQKTRSFATRLFQMRDHGIYLANRQTNALQREIQRLAGSVRKRKGVFAYSDVKDSKEARLLDQAMLVARDVLNNPDKVDEFRNWADSKLADRSITNEERVRINKQLEVLDKAVNLTPEQQKFLENEVEEAFAEVGKKSKAQGIVRELRDNYVRRIWDMPKQDQNKISGTASNYGFKVSTSASKQRTLETILDGWMAGYELKVNSLSNSYDQIATEIAAIEANKAFIRIGRKTVDGEGQPLFTTNKLEGYEQLNAAGFSVWSVAGTVEAAPLEYMAGYELEVNNYGQRVFLTPPKDDKSTLFEKKQLMAPAELARMINKMTKGDNLFNETPALDSLLRLNAGIKGWILLSSFFHHMAGARSWFFGVNHGWKNGKWNPVKAYKAGLDKIEGLNPLVSIGVRNGLTLGLQQDYDEGLLQQKGYTEKAMEKLGLALGLKAVEAGRTFREMASNSLFKKFFAGLKAEAFAVEFAHEMQKDLSGDPDVVAERVARLINEDFGGLHLQRMGRNPTLQKVSRLLLLAPDWTESNFRAFFGQAPGDKLNKWINEMLGEIPPPKGMQKMYRQFWRRIAVRAILSTVLAQLLINGRDEEDREDMLEFYKDQFSSWDQFSRMRWTMVDITKLYKTLGMEIEPGKRKMFSIAGHFTDPIKLANPAKLIKGKGSPAVRVADSAFTGTDWAQRPFTGTKEFLKTGKTIKKSRFEKTEGEFDRLPAMVVNTIVSMQPIQVGQMIRWWQGEEDGLSALMSAAGAHVSSAWEVDQDKIQYQEYAARMNQAQSLYSLNKKYGAKQDEIELLKTEFKKERDFKLITAYKNVRKKISGLNAKIKFLKRCKQTEKTKKKIANAEKAIAQWRKEFNKIYEAQ